jgi:hypothetical protein
MIIDQVLDDIIMEKSQYKYPDTEMGLKFPLLVLAIHHSDHLPTLPDDFKPMMHQTGGIACHQHKFWGKVLDVRPTVKFRMEALGSRWYGSNAGVFGATLDELNRYREDIKELFGADCNYSYTAFEEGIYPLDVTPEILQELCDDNLPADLDKLIQWDTPMQQFLGSMNRWKLYILVENSD